MIIAILEGKIGMFFRSKDHQEVDRIGQSKLAASLTEAEVLINENDKPALPESNSARRFALQQRLLRFSNHNLLSEVAGGIAHEINNPLQYLLARLQLGRLQGCSADDFKSMEREAMRIGGLVKQFVVFSRQDEIETLKPILFNDFIKETIALMQFQFRKRAIVLKLSLDSSAPVIHSQPLILQQSLLNVLVDSRNRVADGGELRLETAFNESDGLRIALSDHGVLRLERLRNQMSLSIEELEETAANDEAMFLATAYHMLNTINSTISIKSSAENGNVVTITVPVEGK